MVFVAQTPQKQLATRGKQLFWIRTEYISLYGEPTNINMELLFRDLFVLRDRFKELGMTITDGEIYLADLENKDV